MALEKLEFTKDWNNPEDFPTYEPSESKVRSDMQQLHDETKDYLNQKVAPAIEAVEKAIAEVEGVNHEHSNMSVLSSIAGVTQSLGNSATKVPSEAAVKKAIDDFSVSAGLGDMGSATYDPQGKKTDVFKYADQAATAAKNAAVAAAKTEAEKLVASAAPSKHYHEGDSLNPHSIELVGSNGAGNVHGGYIDFHYNKTLEDYTTRLVENEEGVLSVQRRGDPRYYELLHTGNAGLINENLLHNWNFLNPVNTRDKQEYTGAGYHVDRWRNATTTDTVTLTANGLRFENKRADVTWMRQYFEGPLEPGTYTLSALVAEVGDAVIYMGTENGAAFPQTLPLKVGLNTITAEVPANTVSRVQFAISDFVTLAAVKLERGSIQTLAEQQTDGSWAIMDQSWYHGDEYARCMGSRAENTDPQGTKDYCAYSRPFPTNHHRRFEGDCNDMPDGVFAVADTAENHPGTGASIIFNKIWDENFAAQLGFSHNGKMYRRTKSGGAWGSWTTVT